MEDAAGILEIYGPIVRDSIISFEYELPDLEEIQSRIQEKLEKHDWLVWEEEARIAGYAYGGAHRGRAAYQWSTEVSVYIHPDFHRRGIARQLYLQLFENLSQKGYHMAFAGISLPNPSSVAFHQSMGFEEIGTFREIGNKFGKWWDTAWLQRKLEIPS